MDMTNTTTETTTQRLTVVGPNLPQQAKATFHVHAEGCADLQRGWIRNYAPDAWTEEYSSLVDVEADVYDFAADESDDYTLGDYLSEFHFAPCVTLPESADDSIVGCDECDSVLPSHGTTCSQSAG